MKIKKKIVFVAISIMFLSSLYSYGRYIEDERWLGREARRIVTAAGVTDRRGKILAIRDYLRLHVRHEGAPYDNRPFLRGTAREVLESGLGYCGESSRACINLLGQVGIEARRINLYGTVNHVVVEVGLDDGSEILIDPQLNPETNGFFDRADRKLDAIIGKPGSSFSDYSTIHLRRMPILGTFIQRVRLKNSPIIWVMESPWLIKALFTCSVSLSALILVLLDYQLMRFYARRLGVRIVRADAVNNPAPGPSGADGDPSRQSPAAGPGRSTVEGQRSEGKKTCPRLPDTTRPGWSVTMAAEPSR